MFKYILSSLLLLLLISPVKADERTCLVEAVYFEARSETFIGKLAVANVILERMHNKSFPNTICGVVKQGRYWEGKPVRNRCQFSYWCDGKPETIANINALEEVVKVVQLTLDGVMLRDTLKATHYHAVYVSPSWAVSKEFVLMDTVGEHIFYKKAKR
jgi:spore germination cell wall hydrolase CwlJ-like protein